MKKIKLNSDLLVSVGGVAFTVLGTVFKHITNEKSEAKKKEEWIAEAMKRMSNQG